MRIGFFDFGSWDYDVASVHQRPLGGSHSALCYLAQELSKRGHDVCLVNGHAGPPARVLGVECLSYRQATRKDLSPVEFAIILNDAAAGLKLRPMLPPGIPLILWTQHAADQPAVKPLADLATAAVFDQIVFVSDWQRNEYLVQFPLRPSRCRVARNAVSPAVVSLFPQGESAAAAKVWPPELVYTSTPYRGLSTLLKTFPVITQQLPGVRLRVFSSMQVYQVAKDVDTAKNGPLYAACRQTPGVEYVGSVCQPELAQALARASVLAYPNCFPETSCIAVMEALAAGCLVVTSDLGALKETTQGAASLIDFRLPEHDYEQAFIQQTVLACRQWQRPIGSRLASALQSQVEWWQATHSWEVRAAEWESQLRALATQARQMQAPMDCEPAADKG